MNQLSEVECIPLSQAPAVVQTPGTGASGVPASGQSVASHLHPKVSWDPQDHPIPTGQEEVWRFTPVKQLRPLFAVGPTGAQLEWRGYYPAGVSVREIELDQARQMSVEPPADRVAALAHRYAGRARLIEVPANLDATEPVRITLRGSDSATPVFSHVVVRVGEQANVRLLLRFEGSTAFAGKFDVVVGQGANVDLVMLNDWAADTIHAAQVSVSVGRDAHVRTVQASLGGALVRVVERSRFDGPGGELEQFGLYFVEGGQHVEHRLFIDHTAPATRSQVDYRGALQNPGQPAQGGKAESAHAVWVGDVLIRKAATGINTYEANRNLLLTEGCRADSVPNLEIETGNIEGAGHSSTTGRFDDEQLFYLCSRGIPEDEARRLVVQGFFGDIIRRIHVPEIEERLRVAVERELAAITGADPASRRVS